MTERTDWSLVDAIQHGDDAAFSTLLERYRRPVLNFVSRMLGGSSDAEDVAQDVFVRAYRGLHQPSFRRGNGEFSTWLFQIARNAALDVLRYRGRHPAESLAALEERGQAIPASGHTSADESAARETGEQVAAAIALLPEDQRTAIVLAEYEEFPVARIAAIMQCSEKSVESRLYRARRFLRERLAQLLS